MNTKEVESALVQTKRLFTNCVKNVVVPNISWGLGFNHELDLLCLSKAGYITEVEIKISRADLLMDFDKKHHHSDPRIKFLYYAAPSSMLDDLLELVPKENGIIIVNEKGKPKGKIIRKAEPKSARKINRKERDKLYALMMMRFWNLRILNNS